MPVKGWRKKQPPTTDDYAVSLHHMQAILQDAEGLVKTHPDLPRVSLMLLAARDADKELAAAAERALRRERSGSDTPQQTED